MVCKVCGRDLPESVFKKNKLGTSCVCNECVNAKRAATRSAKEELKRLKKESHALREMRLADFEPVELMKELKRRGYKFTMNFTEVRVINSDDLD